MKKLSDVIHEVLAKRCRTSNYLAQIIQVPAGSLRGWMSQNRFPALVLRKLQEEGYVPDLTISELERDYRFSVSNRNQVPHCEDGNIESIVNQVEADSTRPMAHSTFERMVRSLFKKLRAGDTFWLFTNTDTPIEWNVAGWHSVADELCSAVGKGVDLFYLSPDTAGTHGELFKEFSRRIITRGSEAELVHCKVHLLKIDYNQAPPIGSKVAIFKETDERRITTLVNTRVPGERWINYRPSAEFSNHMLGSALAAANLF